MSQLAILTSQHSDFRYKWVQIFLKCHLQLVQFFLDCTLHVQVIGLLQKEGIKWSEENRGTLLIRLEGQTDFSFLDSASGSDDD